VPPWRNEEPEAKFMVKATDEFIDALFVGAGFAGSIFLIV
jgi:hypothetical protein